MLYVHTIKYVRLTVVNRHKTDPRGYFRPFSQECRTYSLTNGGSNVRRTQKFVENGSTRGPIGIGFEKSPQGTCSKFQPDAIG